MSDSSSGTITSGEASDSTQTNELTSNDTEISDSSQTGEAIVSSDDVVEPHKSPVEVMNCIDEQAAQNLSNYLMENVKMEQLMDSNGFNYEYAETLIKNKDIYNKINEFITELEKIDVECINKSGNICEMGKAFSRDENVKILKILNLFLTEYKPLLNKSVNIFNTKFEKVVDNCEDVNNDAKTNIKDIVKHTRDIVANDSSTNDSSTNDCDTSDSGTNTWFGDIKSQTLIYVILCLIIIVIIMCGAFVFIKK